MSELSDTINNFSTMLNNPALSGGSSVNFKDASELLGILGALVDRGETPTYFADLIQSLADGGRKPTRAEWAALRGEAQVVEEESVGEEEPTTESGPEMEPEQVSAAGEAGTTVETKPDTGSEPQG